MSLLVKLLNVFHWEMQNNFHQSSTVFKHKTKYLLSVEKRKKMILDAFILKTLSLSMSRLMKYTKELAWDIQDQAINLLTFIENLNIKLKITSMQ
jgi:hypothetical protein